MKIKSVFLALLSVFVFSSAFAAGRYYLEGDGTVEFSNPKNGMTANITYRLPSGDYDPKALNKIDRVFGVPEKSSESMSLRLITLLDHLQDHFKAKTIKIVSGYRSPTYNAGLRKKGRLAASTSLHIEGMAADVEIGKTSGKVLWDYVRSLNCCGAGYYHGNANHVDTGPSRFWDETSTKAEKNLGGNNKLLLLRTDKDIYKPGEKMELSITRITHYPIGIEPEAVLLNGKKETKILLGSSEKKCLLLQDRTQAQALRWEIPSDASPSEDLKIQVRFCEKEFPEMPDQTLSNRLTVLKNQE